MHQAFPPQQFTYSKSSTSIHVVLFLEQAALAALACSSAYSKSSTVIRCVLFLVPAALAALVSSSAYMQQAAHLQHFTCSNLLRLVACTGSTCCIDWVWRQLCILDTPPAAS